jgi:mono/diheme cytochrome c family protein
LQNPRLTAPVRQIREPHPFSEIIMIWQGKMQLALALVLVAAVAVLWRAPQAMSENKNDEALKRGDYLVNNVAQCASCHTPRNLKGEFDTTRHLQGAPVWFKPTNVKFEKWEDTAPDITASGLATKWSEEKLVKLLSSTGGHADAPMPAFKLTEGDARAVVAYLRSLPGKR